MRSPLDPRTEAVVVDALTDSWGLGGDRFDYFPEGGGAYHWLVRATDGLRWFVTCDDLETKPWLGTTCDEVFERLCAAYGAATALRDSGASFVVAPVPSVGGHVAVRIGERHSVSVFEHVDGTPGHWGEPLSSASDLVDLLAALHGVPSGSYGLARRPFVVPGRTALDIALNEVDQRWDGGPLSDSLRVLLVENRSFVVDALAALDRLGHDDVRVVVTHGEPHPGNLIHTADGLALVDWDTVALAPPERDMWMLAAVDPSIVDRYESSTGSVLDRDLLRAYRLLWAVTDIAAFTLQLRGPHAQSEDNEWALLGLRRIFEGREPRPYG